MNFISLLGNVQKCIPQGVKAIKCWSNYKLEPSADTVWNFYFHIKPIFYIDNYNVLVFEKKIDDFKTCSVRLSNGVNILNSVSLYMTLREAMPVTHVCFNFDAQLSQNAQQPKLYMPISSLMCLIMFVSIRKVSFLSLSYEMKRTKQRGSVPGGFIMRQHLILDPNNWRNMLYNVTKLLV